MVCGGFRDWLVFLEARQEFIAPEIIHSYELGFQQGLEDLIARTKDANLRQEFQRMKATGIRSSSGCQGFVSYAIACMRKHGLSRQFDLADCLGYIYEQLLGERKRNGEPKANLFAGFDETRPYQPGDNPLEARYKVAVGRLVRAIATGRIRRLRDIEQRPAGTLSIYGGRDKGFVSPDEIPGRSDSGFHELLSDITTLLQQRQRQSGLPLVDLFKSIVAGEGTRVQRSRFGYSTADAGRRVIVQTIENYARRSENYGLLRLLDKIQHPEPQEPRPPRQPPKPRVPHGDAEDYRSIIDVLEKAGRRGTLALLASKRSRWRERPPRDPSSPHKNRLYDVLARMVDDQVLTKDGAAFVPGPRYSEFLPQVVLQNQ
jgi:hypothetical protein